MVLLMGLIMAATLTGDGATAPVYPLKPIQAADIAPHVATDWDVHWIAAARQQFAAKRSPAKGSPLALLMLVGLALIIWIMGRQELERERRWQARRGARGPSPSTPQGGGVCYGLASRWGLR
jgi:hypothetical protein